MGRRSMIPSSCFALLRASRLMALSAISPHLDVQAGAPLWLRYYANIPLFHSTGYFLTAVYKRANGRVMSLSAFGRSNTPRLIHYTGWFRSNHHEKSIMKFTAQFTILAAVLFTFVVAAPMKGRQMAPSGPSNTPSVTRRDNHGCAKKKTCTECIAVRDHTGNVCGFSRTDGCVELSQADPQAPRLAQTETDCKTINSQQNTQPPSDAANVYAAWNKMKTHVLGGDQTGTAGTHLTKAWIAKHPNTMFQSNPETGLSVTGKSKTNKNPKTLWNNNGEAGHQYTENEIETMCKTAIGLALKQLKADKLPKTHTSLSFSVKAFGTTNICITVQGDTSCFPMDQEISEFPVGQQCR